MDAEQGQSSYFARGEQSFYAEKRARNDFGWTIAYCLWAALTVFWGIAAFTHTVSRGADQLRRASNPHMDAGELSRKLRPRS